MNKLHEEQLKDYVNQALKKKHIFGFSIHVKSNQDAYDAHEGHMKDQDRFFIASTTKMFICAIIMNLVEAKKLSLEDLISAHLDQDVLKGLHVYKKIEYSHLITIKHLLSNTSGLPDYFDRKLISELVQNKDQSWFFDDVISKAKSKQAKFPPGFKRKTFYSDVNFRLLQKVIENVTKQSINESLENIIFKPLGLNDTYLYQGQTDERLSSMYFKENELILPNYMASIGAEGGIVSTAKDLNIFLEGFFEGKLFSNDLLPKLYDWKLMIGPSLFYYGIGITNQPISLSKFKDGIYGHWGQSGAFAFYDPKKKVYLSGTANQFYGHQTAAKVMLKVLKHF